MQPWWSMYLSKLKHHYCKKASDFKRLAFFIAQHVPLISYKTKPPPRGDIPPSIHAVMPQAPTTWATKPWKVYLKLNWMHWASSCCHPVVNTSAFFLGIIDALRILALSDTVSFTINIFQSFKKVLNYKHCHWVERHKNINPSRCTHNPIVLILRIIL